MAYVYTRNTCTTLQGMKAMKVVLNLPTHSFWVNVVCGTSSLLGGACGTLCVILILMSFNSGSVKNKRHYCENRIKGEETKTRHVYIPPEPLGHMPNVLFLMPEPKDGCVLVFVFYRV